MNELLETIIENGRNGTGVCSGCPAYKDGRSEHVHPGLGEFGADIMFLTIEPSSKHTELIDWDEYSDWDAYNNDFFPKALAWDSGEAIDEILQPLQDVNAQDVWMADSLKCSPNGKSNQERSNEFDHCQHYLEKEIELCEPKVIVALGALPIQRVLDLLGKPMSNFSVRRQAGRIIDTNPPVIISTSWSYGNLERRISGIKNWGQGWLSDHPHLKENDQDRVIDAVRASLKHLYSHQDKSKTKQKDSRTILSSETITMKKSNPSSDDKISMSENVICGARNARGIGRCEYSAEYPDGYCSHHSDYSDKSGPTALEKREICNSLRAGMTRKEALEETDTHSALSHDRWENVANQYAKDGEFTNDFIEYIAYVQWAEADHPRAPHRWVHEAANLLDFAIDALGTHSETDAAILEEYARSLRRKGDELEANPPLMKE